jgi:hypothetical protein
MLLDAVASELVEVLRPQLTVGFALGEDVEHGGDKVMRYGQDCPLGTTASGDAPEKGAAVGVLDPNRGPGALDDEWLQPGIARPRPPGLPLAGTLVVPRHSPAHDDRRGAEPKQVMSTPTSAKIPSLAL